MITQCMLLLLAVITDVKTQSSDGYTDENRPYKFAFNIDGYQHRSEEKDEKGIIKGEYGFVTGDGVYHVTVYATDENGNFRILSMKNYYIGLPNEATTTTPVPTTTTLKPETTTRKLQGVQGCGGCLIPNSNTRPNTEHEVYKIDIRFGSGVPKTNTIDKPESKINKPLINDGFTSKTTTKLTKQYQIQTTTMSNQISKDSTANRMPEKQYGNITQTSIKTQKNPDKLQIPISGKSPAFQPGDPSGLLYEFNQTQTFQSHHEKGFLDNSKQGDYFVNGRDGIQQIVEYVADDSGYQPHIRFQNISALETPNPDTEKLENVLKGMYFKWFYKK